MVEQLSGADAETRCVALAAAGDTIARAAMPFAVAGIEADVQRRAQCGMLLLLQNQ